MNQLPLLFTIFGVVGFAYLAAHLIILRQPAWAVRLLSTFILNRMGRNSKK